MIDYHPTLSTLDESVAHQKSVPRPINLTFGAEALADQQDSGCSSSSTPDHIHPECQKASENLTKGAPNPDHTKDETRSLSATPTPEKAMQIGENLSFSDPASQMAMCGRLSGSVSPNSMSAAWPRNRTGTEFNGLPRASRLCRQFWEPGYCGY